MSSEDQIPEGVLASPTGQREKTHKFLKRKEPTDEEDEHSLPAMHDIPKCLLTIVHGYCPDIVIVAKISQLFANDFEKPSDKNRCKSTYGYDFPILPYSWAIPHLKREFLSQFQIDQPFWDWVARFGYVSGGSILRGLFSTKFTSLPDETSKWPTSDSDIDVYAPMELVHSAAQAFREMFCPKEALETWRDCDTFSPIKERERPRYENAIVVYNMPWKGTKNKIQLIGVVTSLVEADMGPLYRLPINPNGPGGKQSFLQIKGKNVESNCSELLDQKSSAAEPVTHCGPARYKDAACYIAGLKKQVERWIVSHFDLAILRVSFDGNQICGHWNRYNPLGITQRNWQSQQFDRKNGQEPDTPIVVSDKKSMELVIRSHKYSARGFEIQLCNGQLASLPKTVYVLFTLATNDCICPVGANLDWLTENLLLKAWNQGISVLPLLIQKQKECNNPDKECWAQNKMISYIPHCTVHAECRNLSRTFYDRFLDEGRIFLYKNKKALATTDDIPHLVSFSNEPIIDAAVTLLKSI